MDERRKLMADGMNKQNKLFLRNTDNKLHMSKKSSTFADAKDL